MAYTENHCDLNRIKDKPIFGFTIRQILSFATILLLDVPLYILLNARGLDTTITCLIICLVAVPIFFAGTYEDINGRPVEKVIYTKIRLIFLTKNKRPFSTNNMFSAIKKQRQLEERYKGMVRAEQLRKREKNKKGKRGCGKREK